MNNITLIKGDISAAPVDAIVNAANERMLGGGGVDGAIHRAAGPQLLEECRKVSSINGVRCPTGEARITLSGNLKSKYVIHTVGPRYKIAKDPEHLLIGAYQSSLDIALENDCKSIAFPAISCGAYGYPSKLAAKAALGTCLQEKYKDLSIYFYLFGSGMTNIWRTTLDEFGECG